jgi:hypothetical protein
MIRVLTTLLLVSVITCASAVAGEEIKFAGLWSLDIDRTMEDAKKSPKYTEKDAEIMASTIKRRAETMKLRITPSEVIYEMGKKKATLPYTIVQSSDESAVLSTRAKDKDFTLSLQLIDGKFLKLKSSDTDDMDLYVWKREASAD